MGNGAGINSQKLQTVNHSKGQNLFIHNIVLYNIIPTYAFLNTDLSTEIWGEYWNTTN